MGRTRLALDEKDPRVRPTSRPHGPPSPPHTRCRGGFHRHTERKTRHAIVAVTGTSGRPLAPSMPPSDLLSHSRNRARGGRRRTRRRDDGDLLRRWRERLRAEGPEGLSHVNTGTAGGFERAFH